MASSSVECLKPVTIERVWCTTNELCLQWYQDATPSSSLCNNRHLHAVLVELASMQNRVTASCFRKLLVKIACQWCMELQEHSPCNSETVATRSDSAATALCVDAKVTHQIVRNLLPCGGHEVPYVRILYR